MAWLDPIASALDRRVTPLPVFVRDDDAGWNDAGLFALLDLFEGVAFPIDLAVIPAETTAALASELVARARSGRLGLHQHGFAHTNHQRDGRKCEFGDARTADAQRADLLEGQRILLDRFNYLLDPIFTPPWNRCTSTTAKLLGEVGIRTLSRNETATVLDVDLVAECPIHVDWFAKRKGRRLTPNEWSHALAARVATTDSPLGVMLHHAVMDDDERRAWLEVLRLFSRHPHVRGTLMREIALQPQRRDS